MSASSATHLNLHIATNTGTTYIDLAYELSRLNHRLYRQGRVYHADIICTNEMAAGQPHTIKTIAPTWMALKAWQAGFKAWRASTKHEREHGVVAARWSDFRVRYDSSDNVVRTITNGEYNYTNAARQDTGALLEFQMFDNTSATRFGLIAEYDKTQDTVQDVPPAGSSTQAYRTLLAELVNEQAVQLQEEGDEAPYNSVILTEVEQEFNLRSPVESNYYRTGMVPIPCGLIKVQSTGAGSIMVKLKAGRYKGVHAESIA